LTNSQKFIILIIDFYFEGWNETAHAGFRIQGSNGNAEFNNATIRGTLVASNVTISGTIAAGTAYLLKAKNYTPMIPGGNDYVIVKDIFIPVGGTCRLKIKFIRGQGSYYTYYLIKVNGNTVVSEQILGPTSGYESDIFYAINLPNNQNTIELYAAGSGGPLADGSVYNTTFEVWVANNPGLLSVLCS
jgi:hypothetical protein